MPERSASRTQRHSYRLKSGAYFAVRCLRTRRRNRFSRTAQAVEVKFNSVVHFAFDAVSRLARGDAAGEIGRIGGIAGRSFFNDDQVPAHFNPACLRIVLDVDSKIKRCLLARRELRWASSAFDARRGFAASHGYAVMTVLCIARHVITVLYQALQVFHFQPRPSFVKHAVAICTNQSDVAQLCFDLALKGAHWNRVVGFYEVAAKFTVTIKKIEAADLTKQLAVFFSK